jgi:hypothetical protein
MSVFLYPNLTIIKIWISIKLVMNPQMGGNHVTTDCPNPGNRRDPRPDFLATLQQVIAGRSTNRPSRN